METRVYYFELLATPRSELENYAQESESGRDHTLPSGSLELLGTTYVLWKRNDASLDGRTDKVLDVLYDQA